MSGNTAVYDGDSDEGPPEWMDPDWDEGSFIKATMGRRDQFGAVIVAVDGSMAGWNALDWAAEEAISRQSPLKIMHKVDSIERLALSSLSEFEGPEDNNLEAAKAVLDAAETRAAEYTGGFATSSYLVAGPIAAAAEELRDPGALVVVAKSGKLAGLFSRSRPFGWSILRRTGMPLVTVGRAALSRADSRRPIMVALHGQADSAPAVEYAFRAALRRKVGVVALHSALCGDEQNDVVLRDPASFFASHGLHDALRIAQDVYPEVPLRIETIVGPPTDELPAASEEGQLMVVSCSDGALSRSTYELAPLLVLRESTIPVVLVKADPA
jgi:nucleotide-binding universal stress UspA family protein